MNIIIVLLFSTFAKYVILPLTHTRSNDFLLTGQHNRTFSRYYSLFFLLLARSFIWASFVYMPLIISIYNGKVEWNGGFIAIFIVMIIWQMICDRSEMYSLEKSSFKIAFTDIAPFTRIAFSCLIGLFM